MNAETAIATAAPVEAMSAKQSHTAVNAVREQLLTYEQLRGELETVEGIDEQTILDTLEGATDLHECLLVLADEVMEREAQAEGLKAYVAQLNARRSRVEKTAETFRTIICAAMARADLKKIPGQRVTLGLQNTPPALVIKDESQVPSKFFRQPPPELDKKAIKDALKNNEPVEGVELSNGGITLVLRVK